MTTTRPPFDRDHLPPGIDPPSREDPASLGRYSVVGRIGAGGMGAVYAGVDEAGGCAAVKVIHPQFAADPEFLARFAREVDLVSRVRGTCTAAFYDADVSAGTPWLATEYVRGLPLRGHVRENGVLTGGVLLALAVGLAEGLSAIHAAGVVHRDLKPGNVIMSPTGPKVLDFGIARTVDGTALTKTGGLVGTPGWAAPELFEGVEATDRSDMFAWGGMVAFAATGRNPFGTGAADALVHRTRREEPDLDGVPPELLDLVRRAMDKDPARRPTADQALDELTSRWSATRVQRAPHVQPAPPAPVPPTQVVPELLATEWRGISAPEPRRVRRTRRGPVVAVAATAAVLVAALVAVWLVVDPSIPGADDPSDAGTDAGQDGTATGGDGADSGSGGGEVTVEDGPARVAQARRLALDATSFEAFHGMTIGGDGSEVYQLYRYEEDPQPVYLQSSPAGPATTEVMYLGEGLDDTVFRTTSRLTGEPVVGPYYRDPGADPSQTEHAYRERLVDDLDLAAEAEGGVEYLGTSDAPVTLQYPPEEMGGMAALEGINGHHYTGTYSKEVFFGDAESAGMVDHTFDLWVDDEGYPLLFTVYSEPDFDAGPVPGTDTTVYLGFNEDVDIEVPDESEIQPGPPGF
ncbi:serine/threonine-protein kinase [Nocardiopsis aegyptia]|uniref:serine/threonine-protein kinase n=1 Tax=Nocardiopsis aegyptia TaxID=220378 RepID=UPI00366EE436